MGTKWLLIVVLILCFNIVSSAVVLEDLNKDLQAGETFVGKIEVNLKTGLEKGDVKVFEDRREVFFEKDIFSYGNMTFIYVVFPKEGNFSIRIDSFLYYENSSLEEGSINHSIGIRKVGIEVLGIRPGIISGSNLSIFLTNLGSEVLDVEIQGNNSKIEVNSSKRVSIIPGEEFFYLDVSSYRDFLIPVRYFNISDDENESEILNETNDSEDDDVFPFRVSPLIIYGNLTVNKTFTFAISLVNDLNETIEIEATSDFQKIDFNKSFELKAFEERDFVFDFFSENSGVYNRSITFSFDKSSKEVSLLFYVLEDEGSFEEFFEDFESNLTCADAGGEDCSVNEECVGGSVRIFGGFCCIGGQCKSQDELYPTGKKNYFVGILSVVIAGVLGYFVYKRFKEVKATSKI